jgi:hypothetical protein
MINYKAFYRPNVTRAFCVMGLLAAMVTWNGLAVLGWVAAICAASLWVNALRASGRGS